MTPVKAKSSNKNPAYKTAGFLFALPSNKTYPHIYQKFNQVLLTVCKNGHDIINLLCSWQSKKQTLLMIKLII